MLCEVMYTGSVVYCHCCLALALLHFICKTTCDMESLQYGFLTEAPGSRQSYLNMPGRPARTRFCERVETTHESAT